MKFGPNVASFSPAMLAKHAQPRLRPAQPAIALSTLPSVFCRLDV
jgi:hypothetical protein